MLNRVSLCSLIAWLLLTAACSTPGGAGPTGDPSGSGDSEAEGDPRGGDTLGDTGGDANGGDAIGGDTNGGDANGGDANGGDANGGDANDGDASGGDAEACPLGAACNPIPIDAFPFSDSRDSGDAGSTVIDSYACAPATNESGPEVFYRVTLAERGVLIARISDGTNVDVDIHLLGSTDPASCLSRNDRSTGRLLDPGTYILVADSWVDGSGTVLAGAYTLDVDRLPVDSGPCALQPSDLEMLWSAGCDGLLDCYESGGDPYLRTPSFGPVVMEAHLVTVADDFGGGWPTAIDDGIAEHYALSEAATCLTATRNQVWAPQEGGSQYGQGASGAYLPVVDEAWYVNMYWRSRPARGTRMLVINPENGRAVVASGGYETGPGSNTAIGGAVEEIHRYLGTSHRSNLLMGFAADGALPLGPFDCATGQPVDLCP